MKNLVLALTLVISAVAANAQCVVVPYSLQKNVALSSLVVEGTVLSSRSFWDAGHKNIYTSNIVLVHKLFSGSLDHEKIEVITEGGIVGLTMHRAEPSLQVSTGQTGIFTLRPCRIGLPESIGDNGYADFEATASVQSFIQYDLETNIAYGYFRKYEGIETLLIPEIESYTGKGYEKISDGGYTRPGIRPLATPIIDSFSRDTITAGTGSKLTIYGSNFSFSQGTKGKVMFTDPNYGDGRYYDELLPSNYVSWSNSKIEVIVPTRAGTGKVKVVNAAGEAGESSVTIAVIYSHQNVKYGNVLIGIDTAYFHVDQVNLNAKGGYSWQFNNTFKSNFNAVNAFLRSMETWRCGTLVNWNVGDDTSIDTAADDGVNIVHWTNFTDNRLGLCWTRFGGCLSSGPAVHWHAEELDIEFDKDRNWYFGDDNPQTSQYDFESVATHELGHGHLMGHVINPNKMMHYSISIGNRNVDLHPHDVSCGEYIRDKSKVSNPCGPGPIVPIAAEDCNITRPKAIMAASQTTICPGDTVTFTDISEGVVKSYSWNFGNGAQPSGASTQGPHKVVYTLSGTVTATMIAGNDFGADTATVQLTVQPAVPDMPGAFAYDSLICTGARVYVIGSVARATSYKWSLPDGGGSFITGDDDTLVNVDWTGTGMYRIQVVASNSCGSGDPFVAEHEVRETVTADFSAVPDGRNVSFTNESSGADSYTWYFGDGDSSVATDPDHEYAAAGTYQVELKAANECSEGTKIMDLQVNWGVGIDEINHHNLLVINPNPAENTVTCTLSGRAADYTILELHDMSGQLVLEKEIDGRNHVVIDIRHLNNGVYMLRLRGDSGVSGAYRLLVRNP